MHAPTTTHYTPRPSVVARTSDLDAAYRAAGLEPPTKASAVADLVRAAEPAVYEVERIAFSVITSTGDPKKTYEQALAAVARAHAAELLRTSFGRAEELALEAALPGMQAKAATDWTPAFNASVESLTKAATKLPTGDPFDLAAVVTTHATRSLEAAGDALALLSALAGSYDYRVPGVPVTALLPILDLPDVAPEQVYDNGLVAETVNHDQLQSTGTLGVRELARVAQAHGLDRALLEVARGTFPGVTFNLATNDQAVRDRAEIMARAHERHHASPELVRAHARATAEVGA